jgi:hexosaminidase
MNMMKKRSSVWLLPFISLLMILRISAGTVDPQNQLKLMPSPKEIRIQSGSFRVRPSTQILIEFGHQDEDRIAAETLAEEISDQAGLSLNITGEKPDSKQETKQQRSAIVLARLQDRRVRRFLASKGLKADPIGDQGYLLFSDESHLIVAANTGQGLFYGVQTLRQLLRPEGQGTLTCPAVSIRDWPSIERRGAKPNLSRDIVSAQDLFPRRI